MATVASPAGYVWEDPGDSIMIQVSIDLVERLGAAIKQGLGTGPRGMEIGGLLLGRALPGFGRSILVDDFEPMPCEYLRGASYTLSINDRQLLGRRLARRSSRQVVGYFRSHTRPGMYLDQDDFAIFSRYFQDPSYVFLLVKPSLEGGATGGFFFWEDGDINRRSPYRQFPFDAEQLAVGGFPLTGEPEVVAARPVPAPRLKPIEVWKPVEVGAATTTPRAARIPQIRFPQLPWLVVPIIAGLFLVAGLFVSENRPTKNDVLPAARATVPFEKAESLLPQPVVQAAETKPAVAETQPQPVVPVQEAVPVPVPAKPKAAKAPKPAMKLPVAPPPGIKVAHTPVDVERPPALMASAERTTPIVPGFLPSVKAAPQPEAAVTYEQPHAGVFKRAFHKIASDSSQPAEPTRKVAPSASGASGEVDVKVFIDESGNVSRAQVLTKGSELAAPALAAARQWQFTPARHKDKPVASEMVLHFRF